MVLGLVGFTLWDIQTFTDRWIVEQAIQLGQGKLKAMNQRTRLLVLKQFLKTDQNWKFDGEFQQDGDGLVKKAANSRSPDEDIERVAEKILRSIAWRRREHDMFQVVVAW